MTDSLSAQRTHYVQIICFAITTITLENTDLKVSDLKMAFCCLLL